MADAPRSTAARIADTHTLLDATDADCWVASASPDGRAHLVPLSYAWDGERLLLALDPASATARNVTASKRARVALGHTRDVVMIDAELDAVVPVEAAGDVGERYATQADWDPRRSPGYVFVCLRPRRIQAWREANEIEGRTILRDGQWVAT